ncbi:MULTISPECIES: fumarate reductase [Psychromonas]|uniref:fumarate reductase n=1 Tax=Psychromonas TaxID=67572 RepID=UPI00041F54E0|nr:MULTISPECIES: fumarate reductase [Psychromonas]MBB1273413.1 fumarate reductase subunit C [Psychromonas sp. SR45-3]
MSKRKPYQREMNNDWWLKNAFYSKYMIREGSSILITLYSLILAWGVFRLSQGEEAFNAWLSALQHPISIIFHLLVLLIALYHTITWFSLAPKAVDLYIKGKPLDAKFIVAGHYISFIIVTIFCLVVIML